MIYHEKFGEHLRLGNFLFKYAWSIAKKEQFAEVTSYPEYYLWQYLRWPPIIGTQPKEFQFAKVNWEWSEDEEKKIDSIIRTNRNVVVSLDSFFQSEKWFENRKWEVYQDLSPRLDYGQTLYRKYDKLFDKPVIGIGVRLGDFVDHGDFYQIPIHWYTNVLEEHFPNWKTDYNVMVFSDDIEFAKRLFQENGYHTFNYAEANNTQTHAENFKFYHGDAAEQFFLGTLCQNFIIGNSTFSWWQAWLMQQREIYLPYKTTHKVVHSGKVFSNTGNMKHIDTSNYYPKNWIKYDI